MSFRFLGFAFLIVAMNSAYACPKDLIGKFACTTDEDTTEEITIRKLGDQKQVSYEINGSTFAVDDVDRPIATDDPGFHNAVAHVSCTDSTLSRHLTADFYDSQEKVGSIDSTIEYSLENDDLIETTSGKMTNSKGDIPLDKKTVCKRE
jgi:hypothetical protein